MMIEELLVSLVERFNRRTQESPGIRQELEDKHRIIQLNFTDAGPFTLELKEGKLGPPHSGNGVSPQVKITTDTGTFQSLVKKELGPIKALYSGKLKIDASLEDKILLRRLI
ncbi:MAG: SCP2 sterol-binding domain-containing protein [Euryarchaeota archaeon]|nr:SCP2 sterol-binding domain-containing protein [Euryarchaeota archaeon]MDE1836029.1 SCP2 sterol-binding domain-containing protein [Euryarchaeota archaeon]MDE1881239.1 SCP2 sterol-binding domain-containing protein [Euryarchaeota archaeon]MDE2046385.1 SCP2 sterol-binding domain-containing protein [Thermoplasmata archaeon]